MFLNGTVRLPKARQVTAGVNPAYQRRVCCLSFSGTREKFSSGRFAALLTFAREGIF
jgi:hypothetical protein